MDTPIAKEAAENLVATFYSRIEHNLSEESSEHAMFIAKELALISLKETLKAAIFAKQEIYEHYLDVRIELEKL